MKLGTAFLATGVGVLVGALVALFVWVLVSNSARIGEIQTSRLTATQTSCEQQNERHERLFARIEATPVVQRVKEPAKYKETVAKSRELEALLNAVQPEEDCVARAHQLVVETLHHETPASAKHIREPGPLRLPPP